MTLRTRQNGARTLLALVLATTVAAPIEPARAAKDVGPVSASCDDYERAGAPWRACVGKADTAQSDAELFYAGYWLARSGAYGEALSYLRRAKAPDERILTYIGFATRKLGRIDEAFAYYDRALARNPDFSVARAYRGEAYLSLGQRDKARAELAEIERRSGRASAEWAELADAIAKDARG